MGRAHRLRGRPEVACDERAAALNEPTSDGALVNDESIRLRVERARAGEGGALGELFERLRPDVMRLCTRLLGHVDAEDAANDAFQRAQHRLESYDPAQPFRRWLLSIAAHQCIDRLRRRSLEKRLFDPDREGEAAVDDLSAAGSSALEGILRAERQAALQAALDGLPDRYRAPLVLRYFVEQSYDEIGEELGIPKSQVASLLFRGKQRLRALLSVDSEGGS